MPEAILVLFLGQWHPTTWAARRVSMTYGGGQRPRFPTMRFTGLGSTAVAPLLQLLDFTNNE